MPRVPRTPSSVLKDLIAVLCFVALRCAALRCDVLRCDAMQCAAQVITWQQLGFHQKPIGLLNTEGFFDPLLKTFDSFIAEVCAVCVRHGKGAGWKRAWGRVYLRGNLQPLRRHAAVEHGMLAHGVDAIVVGDALVLSSSDC